MLINNGTIFADDFSFKKADILTEGDRIVKIAPAGTLTAEKVIDAEDKLVLPGFVDIHVHGAAGADFCDADPKGLTAMAEYEASVGVTSFVPATMAYSEEILSGILGVANPLFNKANGKCCVLRGVNMEGPFFSKAKKGAQNEKYIVDPDVEMFDRLFELSGGNIRILDVAPELPGSEEFIRRVSKKCVVSIAHTTADYDTAKKAFAAGASHVTHLFNAMPPFSHRDPGVVGAASDDAAHVEMISDGIHLHPAVVRSVFKWFGADRVCLISDSMCAAGMPNGVYALGGQTVYVTDGKATLEDGTIAGSATCLAECCRRAIRFGVKAEDALRAATANPAAAAGLYSEVGSLTEGKRADILICDQAYQPQIVLLGGEEL